MKPRIVIVGAGFGGLAAAQGLARADVDITLIDGRNHHLFQPLLYQVATAGLSPADIAAPIRAILRDQANVRVVLAWVVGVDRAGRRVQLADGRHVAYDRLIIATGAQHSYLGNDDWASRAPGIKSIDDATAVRRKVLLALEQAETETDPDVRHALLTFAVIGGGPTGVEMAGAIAELTRRSVSRDFRSITPQCSRVLLVEAGPRLLNSFTEAMAEKALAAIRALGVTVLLGKKVEAISDRFVDVGGIRIPCRTVIWAAGVEASPAAAWLEAPADAAGRVLVRDDLTLPGHPEIQVIGDTAALADGTALPGIAPVAKQQGRHAARTIVTGKAMPFRYRDRGKLATIGRHQAVIEYGRLRLSGPLAWLLWCTAHIYFLVGFRNRLEVGIRWLWSYLTFDRSARLITGATTQIQGDRP
ncbi:NAD(P)/FAD-dependent oxidoreductase [Sandarakinorhabdus rubra]|uniref:NAD(P)/FAD-dependent oxidoreductase n=1 Tax=Sandarakinorhabdus rubra TaxID=2672568 RepID=UPI0013DA417B|nr:NAD(P)/FAD-dependent oxidoreductase [Sandarakinorhabdus rubra]